MNRRVAAIAAAATAAWPCAQAAEWRVAPSIGTSVVNETNPRLAIDSASDQQAFAADLGVRLDRMSETTSITLNSSAARRQYREDRSLDRSDLAVDLSLQQAATERVSWSASASATRDSTLTSELGTSGETQIGYRHESLGAQLRPQWQVSERWSATAMMQVESDFYPSAGSGLFDYRYFSAGLASSWRRSPQDSIGFVVRTGQLQVAQARDDIRDVGASLEYTRTIDERWNLRLGGGPAWMRGSGSTQRGESFSLGLTRAAQYGAVSLAVDRDLAPTGRGYLTRRDSMSLQLSRDLAPHMSGTLGARYLRSRNVVGALGFTFDDVRYRRVDAGLNWSPLQQWSMELRAGYSAQQQSASGAHASGVDLALGLRWNGKNHVF